MSPVVFAINFRRADWQREQAHMRRRVVSLAVWLLYFGVAGVVLGLFAINAVALSRQVAQLEQQVQHLRETGSAVEPLRIGPSSLELIERTLENPRRWHARLLRLAALMPPDAALTSVALNPENQADAASQNRLVITGTLKGRPGEDRVAGVMQLVSALQADRQFSSGYRSIRLTSSRVAGPDGGTEFVVECR